MKTTLLSLITIFTIIYLPSCSLLDSDTTLVDHIVGDDIYEKKVYIRDTFYLDKIITQWETLYVEVIVYEPYYDTILVPYYIPVYDTVFTVIHDPIYIEVPGECPLRLDVISARLEGGHFYKKYKLSPATNGSCYNPYVKLSFFQDQGFVFPTETFVTFLNGFYLQGNGLTNIHGSLDGSTTFEVKVHCPDGDEALRMTIDTDGGGHIDDVTWLIW